MATVKIRAQKAEVTGGKVKIELPCAQLHDLYRTKQILK